MPSRRLWQLLVAVCLLAGSLTDVGRVAHLLAVRHVACPYDGVLVHEDELPVEARATRRAVSDRETRHVSVAPRHEHGHCAALGAVDRPLALAAIAGSPAVRVRGVALTLLAPVATAVARSVLSYAPKLPPPV